MKISVVIPIYNQAKVFLETYRCIKNQTYKNYEIIIGNDKSTDDLSDVINKLEDKDIKFFNFEENKGYCENLSRTLSKSTGDIVILLGADDIFSANYFERVATAFSDPRVMAVSRAYYWFTDSVEVPVRLKEHGIKNQNSNLRLNINSSPALIKNLLSSCDQLSLLAFRYEKSINRHIVNDVFTAHVYLMVNALKKGDVIFLDGMPLAVRIGVSQTRLISKIYDSSPIMQWKKLVENLYNSNQHLNARNYLLNNWVARNYIGLLQIKNYGSLQAFIREVFNLIALRKLNVLSIKFISITLLCIFVPRSKLTKFVDWFKEVVVARKLRGVKLD